MGADRRIEPRVLGLPLTTIDAFHLPALRAPATTSWTFGGGVTLRIAQLSPSDLNAQVDALLAAGATLSRRPLDSIVASIGATAERLLDRGDRLRVTAEAALPEITGSSPAMIRRVLDGMAADWREEACRDLLRAEFDDPAVLDEFRPRRRVPGVEARACGPRLTTHFFSGNVPGVSVTSLVRALLVKSPSFGKSAVGEPLLAALFARGLAEVDPELGAAVAVTYWPGGEREMDGVVIERAEAVVVYGGADAVRSVHARVGPGVRFLGYGHRVSFGVVSRERLSRRDAAGLAERAALDVATFDQQGCVSPHLFYAEAGGEVSPEAWSEMLAGAMERLEGELPRGRLSPGESSAIRQLRGEMEFAQLAGRGVTMHASAGGTGWTVIHETEPSFSPSCLNRTVRVKSIASIEEVAALVEPVGHLLQTVGIEADEARALPLAESLARLGASRLTRFGRMAWPPPTWLHDGRPPLGDLVRWTDRLSANPSS
jgi:hypothetical protein